MESCRGQGAVSFPPTRTYPLTFFVTNGRTPALPSGAAAGLQWLLLSLLLWRQWLGRLALGHFLPGGLVSFRDLLLVQGQSVGRHLRLQASTLQHPFRETLRNLQGEQRQGEEKRDMLYHLLFTFRAESPRRLCSKKNPRPQRLSEEALLQPCSHSAEYLMLCSQGPSATHCFPSHRKQTRQGDAVCLSFATRLSICFGNATREPQICLV